MTAINIEYVKQLHPVFTKPKRIKIIVGGRGSTKSTGIADYVAVNMMRGQLWCCAREHQNSIEESVHRTILSEIDRLELPGFTDTKTGINHESGGRNFYRGLSRNITSLKSTLSGIDGLWIEEGEDLSDNTLRVLTASVRLDAADTQRAMAGEDVKMPEIIITMNRGSRNGAVAKKWLERAERDLKRCGYYEDDLLMVVEMNYTDMPREWFELSGLEEERKDDELKLSHAMYRHKWHGDYLDEVEGAIIKTEWFEAAIDAHKIDRLKSVFKPHGAIVAAHDPFDGGSDAGAVAIRHGSIITHVSSRTTGEIDQVCDWAMKIAKQHGADWFVWDGDGMGTGLKRQVSMEFDGTKTDMHLFKGGLSGSAQDYAGDVYLPLGSQDKNPKTHAETFLNNRAQHYSKLAYRFLNTYKCVIRGEYIDPAEMISIDSDGVEDIKLLQAELCSIPEKANNRGLFQVMAKEDMKRLLGLNSPNTSDVVMMSFANPAKAKRSAPIKFETWA